ncbi:MULTISPECIES: GPW/gp25 family protein [Amycolatopsis]|uniref:Baseplate protein n=1 Tax=Amycolatopsis vastitatis TaxID=1905142 RepID=A0A229SWM4_9PSEU|nr:GPW/gp25 family protein [Amycolatopsis vastitatis]OXM63547.1 baseplate protein [Amycolatopsis vastitatis]
MAERADLIGRGWAFPGQLTPGGGVRLVGGGEEIDAALRLILSTAPGERVMRPDFGCAMWENLFAPVNFDTLGRIEQSVREAVARWEPRIEPLTVTATAEGDGACVSIDIAYRIRATNDHRNLVFPFYVIPQEEAAP